MRVAVILPAAGKSKRFNADGGDKVGPSKVEQDLEGRPVFLRAIELFLQRKDVSQVILAVDPDSVSEFKFRHGDKLAFHDVHVVPGGKTERWETVQNALGAVSDECTHVAVHDAARPLTTDALINRVFEAAAKYPAVIPGQPVSATLKRVVDIEKDDSDADPLDAILGADPSKQLNVRRVSAVVDRTDVVEVQTPQVFEIGLLRRAYEQITSGAVDTRVITDDAGLVENLGEAVHVVEGEPSNLKITRPADMELARAITAYMKQDEKVALAKKRLFWDDEE